MNTQKSLLQMAFAIFVGIFIGSILALRIERSITWLLVGALSGGSVAWVLCDPLHFIRGIYHGFQMAWNFRLEPELKDWIVKQGRVEQGFWHTARVLFLHLFLGMISFLGWCFSWMTFRPNVSLINPISLAVLAFLSSALFVVLMELEWPIICGVYKFIAKREWDFEEKLLGVPMRYVLRKIGCYTDSWELTESLFMSNIITASLLLLMTCISLVVLFVFLVPRILIGISSFSFWTMRFAFLFIHSEKHTQSFAYAAMGVSLMWWINASVPMILFGAALGAIIGAIGYHFVTRRFLHSAESAETKV